jgi:hypothetical protein
MKRRRPHDGGHLGVLDQFHQRRFRLRQTHSAGMQDLTVAGLGPALGSIPLGNGVDRPLDRFVLVTLAAGIGDPELERQIGPWHPQAVVVPWVDHHVVLGGHVTVDAEGSRGIRFVEVVLGARKHLWRMATDASGIPREMELEIVGVVTVAAGHTLLIESLFEQRQTMGVQQRAIE